MNTSRQALATAAKQGIRRLIISRGWELRRFSLDLALDLYVPVLLQNLEVNCVLDVGGHFGEYGAMLRRRGYRGHILSFEPVKENFRRLHQHTAGDPLWSAYPYALGSSNEATEINVSRDGDCSSFLAPNDYGLENYSSIAMKHSEAVAVRRLDDIFDEVTAPIDNPRVYLKMDTQGWDLEVFRGAENRLRRVVALQTELSLQALYEGMPDWVEALSEFQRAGFVVSAMFNISRDPNFQLIELDCVMVRN